MGLSRSIHQDIRDFISLQKVGQDEKCLQDLFVVDPQDDMDNQSRCLGQAGGSERWFSLCDVFRDVVLRLSLVEDGVWAAGEGYQE